ncbi:MAG TPA: hypothetical protein VN634_21295 [Candidatus Limnocylindrales bacterium]|nr:hypothetical protein [Candidatus Limnocylindrales bacterium]
MRNSLGRSSAALAAAALAVLTFSSAAQAVRPSLSSGKEVNDGANNMTIYDIGQSIHCVSATDSQTFLNGAVSIPDSVKFGKKSAEAVESQYAVLQVSLGDGAGGTLIDSGPLQPATCSISWSIADNDGDGDYEGGTDEMTMSFHCSPGELMATMGFDYAQATSFLSQFGGELGCTMSGVPQP